LRRSISRLAAGLTAGLVLASGCGATAPAATAPAPKPPVAATSVRGGAGQPCRPVAAFGENLSTVASTRLPVPTVVTATMQEGDDTPASTLTQALGVPMTAAGIVDAVKDTGAAARDLTLNSRDGTQTWEFRVRGTTAQLSVTTIDLGGAALARAQIFGPAWQGGASADIVGFPWSSQGPLPNATAYATQLAAAAAAGRASLTVVTGGALQPPPTQIRFYWGPFDIAGFAAAYAGSRFDLCGAWRGAQLEGLQNGRLVPVQTSLADIGNGGRLGFGGGMFVTESQHAGIDEVTWYAVPGLRPLVDTTK
jgi:hypothetical protein